LKVTYPSKQAPRGVQITEMFTEVKQYLFLYKAEHNVKQNIYKYVSLF